MNPNLFCSTQICNFPLKANKKRQLLVLPLWLFQTSGHDMTEEPGTLAAHEVARLPLLPSGPGGVHKSPLRETRPASYRGPTL